MVCRNSHFEKPRSKTKVNSTKRGSEEKKKKITETQTCAVKEQAGLQGSTKGNA